MGNCISQCQTGGDADQETLMTSQESTGDMSTRDFLAEDMSEAERVGALRENRKLRDGLQDMVFSKINMDLPDRPTQEVLPETEKLIFAALTSNPMLSALSPAEMRTFVNYAERAEFNQNVEVIAQGAVGDFFYIVESGTLRVLLDGEEINNCNPGSSFGELAIISGAPRAATVVTESPCVLWKMDRDTFRYAMALSVTAQEKRALECLQQVKILESIPVKELQKVAHAVVPVAFAEGDKIIEKGTEGHIFYMIQQGSVLVKEIGSNFTDVTLGPGQYFGERALETGDVRGATVVAAVGQTIVLALAREHFEQILGPLKENIDRAHNMRVIESTELFASMSESQRKQVASCFEECTFTQGSIIVHVDVPSTNFYVIKEGSVSLTPKNQTEEIRELGPGDYFNLGCLLETSEETLGTFKAKSDVVGFQLSVESFQQVMADAAEFRGLAQRAYSARMAEVKSARKVEVPLSQLRDVAVLGAGTFGRVKLVQDRSTKEVFALKVMHKKEVVEFGQQSNVIHEKNVMLQCHHPFVLNLFNTYKDDHRLYLLLEYCNGGELFTVLHTPNRDGVSAASAKFYCGCVVMALAYLKERHIVYRDLKPENMLIDANGYVKIIDFGFAKVTTERCFTLCGTPEYMAPEIVLGRGYDISVDWWALGILMYECLAGYSPFAARDQNQICMNIVQRSLHFPPTKAFDNNARDLIDGLLQGDSVKRFASGPSGASTVKNHAWFKGVDFHVLTAKQLKAPWVPKVKSATDTRFFDGFGVEDEVDQSWTDPEPGWDEEF